MRQSNGKWEVVDRNDNDKVLGTHDSEEKAREQQKAVYSSMNAKAAGTTPTAPISPTTPSGQPAGTPAYKTGDRLTVKIGTQDVDGTVEKVDTATNKAVIRPSQGGTTFMIDMPQQGQPVVTKAEKE